MNQDEMETDAYLQAAVRKLRVENERLTSSNEQLQLQMTTALKAIEQESDKVKNLRVEIERLQAALAACIKSA